jgi:hypothetical protein
MGVLDNYSLVFVIFINFFGQLKDWIGEVLFLVSCQKGQVLRDKLYWEKIDDTKRIISIRSEQQKIEQKTNNGWQSNTEETKIC